MTLIQLRYLHELARQNFSVSAAAAALNTSQPGVSRQLQQLEAELGVKLLMRVRNRITGLTDVGEAVLARATRLVEESDNIRSIAAERSGVGGRLTLATSHLHARFTLAKPVTGFCHSYPAVALHLRQVAPALITQLVASGEADIGVSTQDAEVPTSLIQFPLGIVQRSLIAPPDHELMRSREVSLAQIACYPFIGYEPRSLTGRLVSNAFRAKGVEPVVVVSASDSDVIKVYVEAGLGVGIVPSIALGENDKLAKRDVTDLFPPTQVAISMRANTFLSRPLLDFTRLLAPNLDRAAIEANLH